MLGSTEVAPPPDRNGAQLGSRALCDLFADLSTGRDRHAQGDRHASQGHLARRGLPGNGLLRPDDARFVWLSRRTATDACDFTGTDQQVRGFKTAHSTNTCSATSWLVSTLGPTFLATRAPIDPSR